MHGLRMRSLPHTEREAGGRSQWDPSGIGSLIAGSFVFAVAVDARTDKAIGMGRVISNGPE